MQKRSKRSSQFLDALLPSNFRLVMFSIDSLAMICRCPSHLDTYLHNLNKYKYQPMYLDRGMCIVCTYVHRDSLEMRAVLEMPSRAKGAASKARESQLGLFENAGSQNGPSALRLARSSKVERPLRTTTFDDFADRIRQLLSLRPIASIRTSPRPIIIAGIDRSKAQRHNRLISHPRSSRFIFFQIIFYRTNHADTHHIGHHHHHQ